MLASSIRVSKLPRAGEALPNKHETDYDYHRFTLSFRDVEDLLADALMVAAVLRLAERADAWTDGLQGYLLSQQGGSEFGRFFDRFGRDWT